MAAKRKTGGKVLEWVSEAADVAAATTSARIVIDLSLDDDEIAEIHSIESEIQLDFVNPQVGDGVNICEIALSMDPSAALSQNLYEAEQYEDLETIYNHFCEKQTNFGDATGVCVIDTGSLKQMHFHAYPVLLATNPCLLIGNSLEVAEVTKSEVFIRIWFTRRKAVGNELARTLLKRR